MTNQSEDPPKRRRLLSDHHAIKKRRIPPFLAAFGDYDGSNFIESKWHERIVPEILWLALLNDGLGFKDGADIAVECAKSAGEVSESGAGAWFAPCSAYANLASKQKAHVCSLLDEKDILSPIQDSLYPLFRFYPEFPLAFLFTATMSVLDPGPKLQTLKRVLRGMTDRHSVMATQAQANATYISFVTGLLVAVDDTSLAQFPEIQHYLATELSKQVAAAVRGHVSGCFSAPIPDAVNVYDTTSSWPKYFWLRGMNLEPCRGIREQL